MFSKKILLFSFLVISITNAEESEIKRFYRFLNLFDYPTYHSKDKNLFLDFTYSSNKDIDSSYSDYYLTDISQYALTEKFDRNVAGSIKLSYDKTKRTSQKKIDQHLSIDGHGSLIDRSVIQKTDILGHYDTASERETNEYLSINIGRNYEKYHEKKILGLHPFLCINIDAFLSTNKEKKYFYHSDNFTRKFVEKEIRSALLALDFDPSLGIGKTKPIEPLYRALSIEKKLKESGVISTRLSDRTLFEIATLIASIDAYRISYEKYMKFFLRQLELILEIEPSVNLSKLDFFSSSKIQEALNDKAPQFYYGFQLKLDFDNTTETGVRSDLYLYDELYRSTDFIFDEHYILEFSISQLFPVYKYVFVAYKISLPLTSCEKEFHFSSVFYQILDLSLYYYLTNSLSFSGALYNIPLKHMLPSGKNPTSLNISLEYTIEEFVTLQLSYIKKWSSRNRYGEISDEVKFGFYHDF